jgi:hypothetical protein
MALDPATGWWITGSCPCGCASRTGASRRALQSVIDVVEVIQRQALRVISPEHRRRIRGKCRRPERATK